MSDDLRQESAPLENGSTHQESDMLPPAPPVQESFGPSFPEDLTTPPFLYSTPLDRVAPGPPSPQSVYGDPPPYSSPAFYSYNQAIPPQGAYAPHFNDFPPQGAYFRPPNDFPMPLPAIPLSLGEAVRQLPRQYWRVLTHPNAGTFAEEQGKAAWNIIWVQLLILGIVEALAILLLVVVELFFLQLLLPGTPMPVFSQIFPLVTIGIVLYCIIAVPLTFFMGSGILYLIARAFKGQGTFLAYCYCYALITTPITVISLVLSIIPCIGSLATLAAPIYTIILLIYMTMGVHRLSGGKASASVLIPIITGILLVVGGYAALLIWLVSMAPTL